MIGIYRIINKLNNKSYIGQSVHCGKRLDEHSKGTQLIDNLDGLDSILALPKLYLLNIQNNPKKTILLLIFCGKYGNVNAKTDCICSTNTRLTNTKKFSLT